MLQPRNFKYRKKQKGGKAFYLQHECKVLQPSFGEYGLKVLGSGRISAGQLESARKVMTRKMQRVGKLWLRCFPDHPMTSKPTETRMGKGKGSLDYWSTRVKAGRILFEMDGIPLSLAKDVYRSGAAKLPLPTRFVQRLS